MQSAVGLRNSGDHADSAAKLKCNAFKRSSVVFNV